MEHKAGVSRRLCAWRQESQDSAGQCLHTPGPDNLDCDIRLDLLGPIAVGSGPGRSKEGDAGAVLGFLVLNEHDDAE
jgi:hypothetical protein